MPPSNSNNRSEDINTSANQLLRIVQGLAAEIHPQHPSAGMITLDSELVRQLGFDSLAKVELIVRIERQFAVSLPEPLVNEAETPRDLLRAVMSATVPREPFASRAVTATGTERAAAAPDSTQTLVEVLQWHVMQHPARLHIRFYSDTDDGETLSYDQLWRGAGMIGAGLQQRGVQAGETVALMLPTCKEYFFSFFGILLVGAIPVPLYPPGRPAQLEDHLRRHAGILDNCRATTLITVPEARRVARLLKAQAPTLRNVVTAEELSATTTEVHVVTRGPQDIALLQYTSGSTGKPKGVVLTHANLLANIRAMAETVQADSRDVFVSWLPLYHDMGLIGAWLGSLVCAVTLVVMSPLAFLTKPQRWFWAIHRYRGTLSAAPNFGYELCLRRMDDQDLTGLRLDSWRAAFNGAEAVSPATMLHFYERFKAYGLQAEALMPVYGLAECAVGLCFPPLDRGLVVDRIQREAFMRRGRAISAEVTDSHALSFAACGPPMVGHQLRIVDRLNHELPERQVGQLQFCGPSTTSGYYRNPGETARLFDGEWLNSGDLAYVAAGDVYISGRIKDIIIRAGRNIYPDELEEAVGDIAGIRKGRVAVFASRDPASGTERLVLVAETRITDPKQLDPLRDRINALVVELTDAPAEQVVLAPPNTVLKTSSGKIRRAACRELYEHDLIGKSLRGLRWQLARVALSSFRPRLRRMRQNIAVRGYGMYARTLFWLIAPVVWLAVAILPRASWRWSVMRAGARALARGTFTPLTVHGLAHLKTCRQPCVMVANHASYLDGPTLVAALKLRFSFVAKAELLNEPVPRVFLQHVQAEFVERFDQQQGVADVQRLVNCAQRGQSLVFFPEGTFTRVAGLLPFHLGAFIAAAQAGVPIVPVAIHGSRVILRAGAKRPRHGAITVWIGEPVYPEAIKAAGDTDWAIALKLRDAARTYILRHCGEPDLQHEKIGRSELPL